MNSGDYIDSRLQDLANIITEHQDSLLRYAFFRLGSMEEAQDVVQDVFVRMFGDSGRLGGIANIRAYLFRSVGNACNDLLRRRKKERTIPLEAAARHTADEEGQQYHHEYGRIEALMGALPDDQAEVIRLKTLNGLTFVQIADILDTPVTTVKSRFKYGIDKIRNKLKTTDHEM